MKRGYQAPKQEVKPFTKKKKFYPSKIKPVSYDDDTDRDSTQTPGSSLPASFIPAPFGGGSGTGFGSLKSFTKIAQELTDNTSNLEWAARVIAGYIEHNLPSAELDMACEIVFKEAPEYLHNGLMYRRLYVPNHIFQKGDAATKRYITSFARASKYQSFCKTKRYSEEPIEKGTVGWDWLQDNTVILLEQSGQAVDVARFLDEYRKEWKKGLEFENPVWQEEVLAPLLPSLTIKKIADSTISKSVRRFIKAAEESEPNIWQYWGNSKEKFYPVFEQYVAKHQLPEEWIRDLWDLQVQSIDSKESIFISRNRAADEEFQRHNQALHQLLYLRGKQAPSIENMSTEDLDRLIRHVWEEMWIAEVGSVMLDLSYHTGTGGLCGKGWEEEGDEAWGEESEEDTRKKREKITETCHTMLSNINLESLWDRFVLLALDTSRHYGPGIESDLPNVLETFDSSEHPQIKRRMDEIRPEVIAETRRKMQDHPFVKWTLDRYLGDHSEKLYTGTRYWEPAPSVDDLNQMFKFEQLKSFTKQAKKLTYGFDIDEVLCSIHTAIVEMAREYVDIPDEVMWEHKKLKDIPGVGSEVQDKVFAQLTDNPELLIDMPQVPGAIEKVNALHDAGHRIVLITARSNGWKEGTEGWLEKNNVKYDKLIVNSGDDKGKYAEEEGVDIFFDDTVKHLEEVAERGIEVYRFDTPWENDQQFPVVSNWDEVKVSSVKSFTKTAAPRWTPAQEDRLKCLYLKWRARGYPHHAIYQAAGQLLGRSFLSTKQKLESMYGKDDELAPMKFEHWDQGKIDTTIQDLYQGGEPVSRLGLPGVLMYQITNHSFPKADTRGFTAFYDSFDHAMAQNILTVGFEREGNALLEDKPIHTLEQALQYYRRKEKLAHNWNKDEIIALFRDAHVAGLPLTHSFFKSHPTIYKPLLGLGRSLEGIKDSIRRNGYDWSDLVIEAAPEYADLYLDSGRLVHSTEEMRIRRFLELNEIPFRVATIQDKYEVKAPELREQGYRNFVPDFFILDKAGEITAIVEVFGSVADSSASNTSELYREKKIAKEQFYQTLPYSFIAINNNADGVDLTDEILQTKFHRFLGEK